VSKAEQLYRRMLLSKSGAERVELALGLLATARQLARDSLRDADPAALRERLFLRLYGRDFGPRERERIAAALRGRRPRSDP
jgi:hypothetical protein